MWLWYVTPYCTDSVEIELPSPLISIHSKCGQSYITYTVNPVLVSPSITKLTCACIKQLYCSHFLYVCPSVLQTSVQIVPVCNTIISLRTPLHWSAATGHTSCARALLNAGVLADPQDVDGVTPLEYATNAGHKGASSFMPSFYWLWCVCMCVHMQDRDVLVY